MSAFQRWLSCMACVAMLLVLAAPLVSRQMNHAAPMPASAQAEHVMAADDGHAFQEHAPDTHSAHGGHHHHDTAAATAPPAPAPARPVADPHANHDMGVECDYCLIAARMLGFVAALLLVVLAVPLVRHIRWGVAGGRSAAPYSRLGARGPPLAA